MNITEDDWSEYRNFLTKKYPCSENIIFIFLCKDIHSISKISKNVIIKPCLDRGITGFAISQAWLSYT